MVYAGRKKGALFAGLRNKGLTAGDAGNNGGGAIILPSVALDPAITNAMKSLTQDVFAFDRMVQDFSGPTARFQRVSDGAQQDFGFDAVTGKFAKELLASWATGGYSLVKRYSQMGTGKELLASGAVIAAQQSFAPEWSNTDGQLTSSAQGGMGIPISGGAMLTLDNSGYSAAEGIEIHFLVAPFARKKASAVTDVTELGATSTAETVLSYGTSASNYMRFVFGGGTAPGIMRRTGTGAGGTDQQITVNPGIFKKNGQVVASLRLTDTDFSFYVHSRRVSTAVISAGNVTANAALGNGRLRIGGDYASASGSGNHLDGAVIITKALGDRDRSYIHSTLNLCGQQHRTISIATLISRCEEIIDFRFMDGNGLVMGRKGKTGIQFNKTVGSPAWDFNATTAQGWKGVRSMSASNANNTYRAINNYFWEGLTGTMMTVCVNENTDINQTFSIRADGDTSAFLLGMGRHHSVYNFQRCIVASRDALGITRTLHTSSGADGGGGKISQANAKYQFNMANGDWTPGQTTTIDIVSTQYSVTIPSGTVLTTEVAATVGWYPTLPEHIWASQGLDLKLASTPGELTMHISTFDKGPYNPADPEATRRLSMRKATNWSYVSQLATPAGHRDGSIAREMGTGSVAEGDPNCRIQSNTHQGVVNMGTHLFWIYAREAWSKQIAEEMQANLYKLVYNEYTV